MKDFLTTPHGSLDTIFGQYHSKMVNQVKEIKGTFNESAQNMLTLVTGADVFKLLKYKVSKVALDRLTEEYRKGENPLCDSTCTCQMRVRDGLPCVHDIARHVTSSIPIKPTKLHPFWRQLSLSEVQDEGEAEVKRKVARSLMDQFYTDEFPNLSADDQEKCVSQLYDIARPERTSLQEPAIVRHKGRPMGAPNKDNTKRHPSSWEYTDKEMEGTPPKKQRGRPPNPTSPTAPITPLRPSQVRASKNPVGQMFQPPFHAPQSLIKDFEPYMDIVPSCMHEHINGYYDILGDGNCGYRAVADQIGIGQEQWRIVRQSMIDKVKEIFPLYKETCLFPITPENTLDGVLEQLTWFDDGIAPGKTWMVIPDMGCLVASAFNCAVVVLGGLNATFLPLQAVPHHPWGAKLKTI